MKLYEYLDKKYTKDEQLNLKKLNCSNSNITSLDGIENLISLKELFCHNNKLTDLIGIENLTLLETLSCYNNQLTDLIGIEKLHNLKVLSCYSNQLTSLIGIENLDLTYLDSSNNPLPYKSDNLEDILKEIKIEKRKNIIKSLL
jgi:Leucine-rich repeat (LRR) protein